MGTVDISSLTDAERAQLLADLGAGTAGALKPAARKPGKWGDVIDAIPDEKIDEVIKACSIASAAELGAPQADAVKKIRASYPDLIDAAIDNSGHRGKPLAHSLDVIVLRLTTRKSKEG